MATRKVGEIWTAILGLVWAGTICVGVTWGAEPDRMPIRLANRPALSPDGATVAFSWAEDVWTVPTAGGRARPLTRNPAKDIEPAFSPDGKTLAFVSDREGSPQVYVMPAEGGTPKQIAYHTAGYSIQGWTPDGRSILVSASRDHFWRDASRFFLLRPDERTAEEPLFDSAGHDGSISPDGKKVLFAREGAQWWRKGYRGSQDSQVWVYDREVKTFTKLLDPPGGALWPLWRADGEGIYYVGLHKGNLNLRERDLKTGKDVALTEFEDDSVVYPCIARDGKTIVFRHLFDLYRLKPGTNEPPAKIDVWYDGDLAIPAKEKRTLTSASEVSFSKDGLEVAFIAGGDVWVMDTELKEPRRITDTPEEERGVTFSPKGDAILFVSDRDGQTDIWRADRADAEKDWWLNERFKLEKITNDADIEASIEFSPDGSKVGFVRARGDLWVMNPDGKEARKFLASWNPPTFDWSPDGKWLVYAHEDADFNSDIWVAPLDGSKPPFNLSKHPDNESEPVWSPDGKVIAFAGQRRGTETDVHFIWLRAEEDEKSSRERTLEKALEKMKQARKKGPAAKPGEPPKPDMGKGEAPKAEAKKDGEVKKDAPPAKSESTDKPEKPAPEVVIDFEDIHERIRTVSIPDSAERGLFWSPDSKRLAFAGTVEGKAGLYTVEFPEDLKPKPLTSVPVSQPRWLEAGNQVVGLAMGVPISIATAGGKESRYAFRVTQEVDRPARFRAAFDLCWRTMRDRFYDEKLGNRNWDAVRRKYVDAAAAAPDLEAFGTVVNLMLGELNGSHLGFVAGVRSRPAPGAEPTAPEPGRTSTAHFGLRFENGYKGPGLKVRDVIPGTPADHKATRIKPGEVVLAIDGTSVDPAFDLTRVLNGPLDRDHVLKLRNADGKEREVTLRPIATEQARALLYQKWVKDNRKRVDELSKGTLGYLHIRGMDFPSFYKFEEELYSAGAGKAGLIIDVRENGGGATADHLLTALTQPTHAITVPRGGGPGYPQDRRVYATWNKPIVVLCNQNSFSNAEIFAHAIKTLKRGKLVGVPTAGGVISTGGTAIMDVGFLRLPGRGWFLINDGEDMELNGAVPDVTVWPEPADFAKGKDAQLDKAVEVLQADVADAARKPAPKLRKATER